MSAPSVFQLQSFSGLFGDAFASTVENLIPARELLLKSVPFQQVDGGAGGDYVVPFTSSRIHGVTFHGQNDANSLLNPATASKASQARVRASSMTMRAFLTYTAMSRAVKGEGSFIDATSYVVENLMDSFSAIIEQVCWYGGVGLGQSASLAGEIGAAVPGYTFDANGVDAARSAVRISFAEWASSIWIGGEGMPVDIYNAAGTILLATTEIVFVDILNRILVLADVSSVSAAAGANVGFKIWRKGSKGYEAEGVHSILTNTGVLFGVAQANSSLWGANQVNIADGQPTWTNIANGIAVPYARGLEKDFQLHVNSAQFARMMTNFLTTRSIAGGASLTTITNESGVSSCCRLDENGVATIGMSSIRFIINSINVEVVVNDYVKGGYMYGLELDSWRRVGSTDIKFLSDSILGDGDNYFFRVPGFQGVEIQAFSDQAMFTSRPARNIIFTGLLQS